MDKETFKKYYDGAWMRHRVYRNLIGKIVAQGAALTDDIVLLLPKKHKTFGHYFTAPAKDFEWLNQGVQNETQTH